MKITVYDQELVKQSVLYSWFSLSWEPQYNDIGFFMLSMKHSNENFNAIKRGWFLIFDEDETRTIMYVDSIQVNAGIVAFSGKSAVNLLKRRVSTQEISNQNAERAVRSLIENMASIPHFVLGDAAGLTDVYTPQISDDQIINYILNITQAVDIGFRAVKKGNNIVFELYKPPLNQNVKFAQKFGNVGNETYMITDTEYFNVAYVDGMASETERVGVWAGNNELTGLERRELYVDARDIQKEEGESDSSYKQRLVQRGEQRLVEQALAEEIGFDAQESVNLGDIVNVILDKIGLTVQARVTSIEYSVQNNKMTRSIRVGTPINIKRRYN